MTGRASTNVESVSGKGLEASGARGARTSEALSFASLPQRCLSATSVTPSHDKTDGGGGGEEAVVGVDDPALGGDDTAAGVDHDALGP